MGRGGYWNVVFVWGWMGTGCRRACSLSSGDSGDSVVDEGVGVGVVVVVNRCVSSTPKTVV